MVTNTDTIPTSEPMGARLRRYRLKAGMSLTQLAAAAQVSKGYLSSLENETAKRPSAETVYALAEALGVTMSCILGRRCLTQRRCDVPDGLRDLAQAEALSERDVRMLAGIEIAGVQPRSRERWTYIYNAVRLSGLLDDQTA